MGSIIIRGSIIFLSHAHDLWNNYILLECLPFLKLFHIKGFKLKSGNKYICKKISYTYKVISSNAVLWEKLQGAQRFQTMILRVPNIKLIWKKCVYLVAQRQNVVAWGSWAPLEHSPVQGSKNKNLKHLSLNLMSASQTNNKILII